MTQGFSISLSMTKKIGVKGITCTLLATFLLLSVGPSLVMATQFGQVCFYKFPFRCSGFGKCCYPLVAGECCNNEHPPGRSAAVYPSTDSDEVKVFTHRSCSSSSREASGTYCFTGQNQDNYLSGNWDVGLAVAEPGSQKSCNETMSTNTFQYRFITEDRRWASWVLPISSLAEADSHGPSLDLPAEEQVIWFKSRGATLKVEDHQTMPVPDVRGHGGGGECPAN